MHVILVALGAPLAVLGATGDETAHPSDLLLVVAAAAAGASLAWAWRHLKSHFGS